MQSMTGFGKGEISTPKYNVAIEIKSVNNRFKDIRFKMPQIFVSIELDLKRMLSEHFKRGSFEVFVNFSKGEQANKFDDLDDNKINGFIDQMKQVAKVSKVDLTIRPCDFLRSEFYKDQDPAKYDTLRELVKKTFKDAVLDLKQSRESEGEKLKKVIMGHLEQYSGHYSKFESLADQFQEGIKERLTKRFEAFSKEMEVDAPRFMQEIVYYMEKMDIHEEINRIQTHLEKLEQILEEDGEVGRQIDFLTQELNRETNTIGSKSSVEEISDAVVQMKVQLEKIREQGLNIE